LAATASSAASTVSESEAMRPREHDDDLPHYRMSFSFSCSLYLSGDVALEVAEVGA
jgi:hypothetical protein